MHVGKLATLVWQLLGHWSSNILNLGWVWVTMNSVADDKAGHGQTKYTDYGALGVTVHHDHASQWSPLYHTTVDGWVVLSPCMSVYTRTTIKCRRSPPFIKRSSATSAFSQTVKLELA